MCNGYIHTKILDPFMPLSRSIRRALEDALTAAGFGTAVIDSAGPMHGGSINSAYRVDTSAGSFFAKVNQADSLPGLFEKEARGLDFLSRQSNLTVPRVIGTGVAGKDAWLLTEFIRSSPENNGFATEFGRKLAEMHRLAGPYFGLEEDNYIGSLPQVNNRTDRWPEFFAEMRISPQLKRARDSGRITPADVQAFEALMKKLSGFFPEENPSPLHGDLWSGNFMADSAGKPAVFDPAVYYGHRYMDLGMTKLFGGFPAGFYTAYFDAYPAETGVKEGTEVANLYPLLVHVNLFGGGYAQQVRSLLRTYA